MRSLDDLRAARRAMEKKSDRLSDALLIGGIVACGAAALVWLAQGDWGMAATFTMLAMAHGIVMRTMVLSRGMRERARLVIEGVQYSYGDRVVLKDGTRGMVLSDRPTSGWVSVLVRGEENKVLLVTPDDVEREFT